MTRCRQPELFNLPPNLDTPAFIEAWESWKRHRKQKGQKLTDETVKRQLRKLALMGVERAIDTIEYTIEKGWTGLFEPSPKERVNGKHYPPAPEAFALVTRVLNAPSIQKAALIDALPAPVRQAAEAFGWRAIADSRNPEACRAQFAKVYESYVARA